MVLWAGPDAELGTADDVTLAGTTDATGRWLVGDLPPGAYRVSLPEEQVPAGTRVVFDREHLLDDPTGVWTGTLGAGERRLDVDDGVRGTAAIGDSVWVDSNRDGHHGSAEPGVPGLTVTATWFGADGQLGTEDDVVFTAVTGSDGAYALADLPAGPYRVVVAQADLPSGLTARSDLDGGDPLVTELTLEPAQHRRDVDFVVVGPVVDTGSGSGLASTGLSSNGPLVAGLLLAAAGVGLLIRRRARARRAGPRRARE